MQNSNKKKKYERRQFIRDASMAVAGFTIVPRHVLGGKGFIADRCAPKPAIA